MLHPCPSASLGSLPAPAQVGKLSLDINPTALPSQDLSFVSNYHQLMLRHIQGRFSLVLATLLQRISWQGGTPHIHTEWHGTHLWPTLGYLYSVPECIAEADRQIFVGKQRSPPGDPAGTSNCRNRVRGKALTIYRSVIHFLENTLFIPVGRTNSDHAN